MKKIQPVLQQDSIPGHILEDAIAFLEKNKVKDVKLQQWTPKNPGVTSMDYAVWRYLKQRLSGKNITTLDELENKLL